MAERELDDLPSDIITIWHDGVALRDGLTGGQNRMNLAIIHRHTSSLDTLSFDYVQCHLHPSLRKRTYARKSAPVSAKIPF